MQSQAEPSRFRYFLAELPTAARACEWVCSSNTEGGQHSIELARTRHQLWRFYSSSEVGSDLSLYSQSYCFLVRHDFGPRSEERRVGKECRSRWLRCH